MRVYINAAGANQGGALTYLSNLLPELAASDASDHYVVIAPSDVLDSLGDSLASPRFTAVPYPHEPRRVGRRLVFDQLEVPALARRHRIDLLYSTNGFGSLVRGRVPELLLVRNHRYFSRAPGRASWELGLRRAWSRLSIRRADGVVFPTEAIRDRAALQVPMKPERSRVLHYGFSPERFFSGVGPEESVLRPLEKWRAEGRPVLLNVSGYAAHKNLELLLEALPAVLGAGHEVKLALTASREKTGERRAFDALVSRVRSLGLEGHVHWLGPVAWRDLHRVYAIADLFLFPSRLESFGHPMVEAMASGLPTVASDTAVNHEILQESALFFPSGDADACAKVILRVLDDRTLAARLRRYATRRAADFSWQRHAEGLRCYWGELVGTRAR